MIEAFGDREFWFFLVIVYLWIVGGFGWIRTVEQGENIKMSSVGTAIGITLYPLFALFSILTYPFRTDG
jgi:hypothetical protein